MLYILYIYIYAPSTQNVGQIGFKERNSHSDKRLELNSPSAKPPKHESPRTSFQVSLTEGGESNNYHHTQIYTVYIYIENPLDPCVDRKRQLFWRVWVVGGSKLEVTQVPYLHLVHVLFMVHSTKRLVFLVEPCGGNGFGAFAFRKPSWAVGPMV